MSGAIRQRVTGGVAVVALLVVGVVLLQHRVAGARASGAVGAAAAPSLFPAADKFSYVRAKGASLICRHRAGIFMSCKLGPARVLETWQSERRKGLRIERPSSIGPKPLALPPRLLILGNRRFTHNEMAVFAPTGAGLLAELQTGRLPGQGNGGESYPFAQLTDALREAMPAKVRQAIIEALRLVPGVTQLGQRRDSLGRRGIGFARALSDVREEVIVDPGALVMLEERTILLKQSAAPGAGRKVGDRIGGYVYVTRAVVSRAGQRP